MPATGNGQVNIKVGFTVDKTGLDDIQKSLREVTKEIETARLAFVKENGSDEGFSQSLKETRDSAMELQNILSGSWNTSLNQLDISRFQTQLKQSGLSMSDLRTQFDAAGAKGTIAFNKLASSILSTNVQIKESNKFLDSMAETFSKTIKWTAASSAIRKVTSSIREAWNFTKDLDESLNNIRIVTGKSADEMAEFAVQANNAAKAMGATTTDYTNASLIFYQQGLNDEEVQARTDVVTKVANVTGQAASEVSDNLTAVWNGYQVTAEQAEESIDILAAVAANTASNLEELSTGMTKVAAAANEMGVGEAQLAAQISTIVSATRQAPETVGQALKTVYARMSTINAGGEDEDDGATLTSYSAKMKQFGIDVLDTNGHLRDMGDVIEEIGGKWEDFSRETQISLAQAMAGTRQYVNVMALFENWDKYESTLEIANNSMGTLQQQQDIYMESTEAHLNQMTASAEAMYNTLFDMSSMNKIIDVFTVILDRVNDFISSLGGGMQSLVNIGLLLAGVFSNQIGNGMAKMITNQQLANQNEEIYKQKLQEVSNELVKQRQLSLDADNDQDRIAAQASTDALETQLKLTQNLQGVFKNLSQSEQNYFTDLITKISQSTEELRTLELQQEKNAKTQLGSDTDMGVTSDQLREMARQEQIIADSRKEGAKSLSLTADLVKGLAHPIDENVKKITVAGITGREINANTKDYSGLLEEGASVWSSIERLQQHSEELSKIQVSDNRTANEVLKEANNLLHKRNLTDEEYYKLSEDLNILAKTSLTLSDEAAKKAEQYNKAAKTTQYVEEGEIEKKREQIDLQTKNLAQKLEEITLSSTIAAITSTITTSLMAITQIQSAIQIFKNDDLTTGQKIAQLLSAMVPLITISIRTIRQVTTAWKNYNFTLKQSAAIEKERAAAQLEDTNVLKDFISNMSKTSKVVAIAAGVLVALGVTINLIVKQYNQLENAAEKASESASALAEQTDKVSSAFDNLQSVIDTYQSAIETLDECTQGTQEWTDALQDANQAALDVVDTLSDLNISGDEIRALYSQDNGLIVLDEEGLQNIVNQESRVLAASQFSSAQGSYDESYAKIRSSLLNTTRDTISFGQKFLAAMGNAGAAASGMQQSGAPAQELEEEIYANINSFKHLNGNIEAAIDILKTFDNIDYITTEEDLYTLAKAVVNCAEQADSASATFQMLAETEIASLYGDTVDNTTQAIAARQTTSLEKQLTDAWKKWLDGGTLEEGQKELLEEYSDLGEEFFDDTINVLEGKNSDAYREVLSLLQDAGLNISRSTENNVIQRDNGENVFVFHDKDTGENEEYTSEQIAATLAATEAINQLDATIENAGQIVQNLNHNGSEGVSTGLENYLATGSFEDMTAAAMNEMQAGIEAAEGGLIEYLSDLINAEKLGLSEDDVKEIFQIDEFEIAMADYQAGLASIPDSLRNAAKEIFTSFGDSLDQFSLVEQQQIAQMLNDMENYLGEANFTKSITNLFGILNQADEIDELVIALGNLEDSWGHVSIDEFRDELNAAGVETDIADDELEILVGTLNALAREADNASNSLSALQETTSDTLSITNGLDRNSTISADNYNTLLENLGSGIQSFFRETTTGEYKLIAAAEDFSNYVDSVLTNQFVQLAKEQENNANRFAEYFSYNSTEINEKGQEVEVGFNAEKVREGALQTYDDIIAYYGKEEIEIPIKTDVVDENGDIVDNITKPSKDAIEALNTLQTSQLSMITIWQECVDVTNEEKEQLNAWNLELEQNGYLSEDSANALHDYVEEIYEGIDSEEEFNEKLQEMNDSYEQIYEQIAFSCDSLDELNEKLEQGQISVEAYNAAWGNLWETQREQDLDSDEIEEYSKYLSSLIKESDEYAKALEYNEKDQAKMNKYMQDAQKVCKQWAIEVLNMNDAIDDLSDNLEGYISCLQDSTASAQETSKAYNGLNEDLQKLLDVSTDFSTEFMVNNLDDLRLAAEGDEEAIDRLRDAALETIMVDIDMDISNFIDNATTFSDYLYSFRDVLDSYDWTVSPEFDTSSFEKGADNYIDGLNELMDAGAITAQQVQDSLRLMGYDVEWTDEEYPVEETYPVTTTLHEVINYKQVPYQQQIGTEIIPSASGNTDDFKTVPIYSTMYLPTWTTKETPSTDYVTADGLDTEFAAEVTTGDGKSYGGGLTTKHIAGITKHASSSMNNKSSVNAGSLTPSTSSSSSPKSSSGSTSEPKQEDHIEDQSDRYHDINLRLQDISTSLARIQRQESKLLGQALIDNLNAQLATLDDYIDATTVKIEIATQEAAELRAELSSQGVTFDSNGYISNYQAAMDAQLATVNAVIDKYNGMSAEEQEAYEDTLQNAKDAYNDFVEALNNYDTLIHETIPGLEDDITDALDQEIQINISKFTMAVEIRLDMDQAEKDWNEFYRKVILGLSDSDLIGQALQNVLDYQSYFDTGAGTGVVQSLTDQINATLDQLHQYDESGWMSAYGDDYAQAFEDLQTYQSELMEILEDIEDIPYEMWEYYTQAIEEATDAVNDHMKAYEDMQSVLDHQLNLIEILYGDEAYDYINGVYDQMLEYDERQLAEYRNQMDMYQGYMNQAYEKMQEALAEGDEEAYKQWYEVYSMWYDAYYDAADSLLTVLEDSFEIAIKEYENSLNQITNDFNQELFGTDLDWASTMWDLQNQYADMYLDTINAMYEVEKLQQKYLDAIDATDSIKGQQELNALMEDQIGYLQEKDKLTQYDIDHAELEYEIALKRIALEEAQQEKSSMRLRRDSQGNYTYQYVTDEDEISNLRSQLLDLEQQLYNLDVNQYKQNISDLLSTIQDFEEQYIEIMTDLTLTDEERQDRLEELYEMYAMLIYGYAEQVETSEINLVQDTFGALEEMYAQDPEMYNAMLKDELAYLRIEEDDIEGTYKERQDQFRQMYGNIYGYAEDAEGNIQYVGKETADAMTKIAMKEDETLQDTISKITNGITNNYIQPVADAIYEAGQEAEDDTNSFMDNALKAFETIFGDFIQEGWDAEQEAEKAIEDLEKAAGYTTDDIINGFEDVMEQVEQNIDVTEEYTEAMWEQLDAIIELCEWLERMVKDYESIVDAAKEAIQASEDYVKSVQEQNAQAAEAEQQNMTGGGSSSSSSSSSSGSSSSSSSSSGTSLKVGSKVTLKKGTQWYWDSWGKDPHGSPTTSEQTVYITRVSPYSDSTKKYHMSSGLGDKKTYKSGEVVYLGNGDLGWVTQTDIKGYKTGGYTGDWNGDEGQLAFLHQKELVLNQQDTQNLLAAVNVVRDVADLLSNLDTDVLTHMHDMMFLTKLQNTDYDSANDLLEQDVHIEANFPNVTNSNEIEQAFNNLVNVASQHAHRAKVRR